MCPRCHCPALPAEIICDVCGAVYDKAAPDSSPGGYTRVICLRCGAENRRGRVVCAQCRQVLGVLCPGCEQHGASIGARCSACGGDIARLKLQRMDAEAATRMARQRSAHRGRHAGQCLCLTCAIGSLLFGLYLLLVKHASHGGGFVSLALLLFLCLFLAIRGNKGGG